MKSVTIEEIFKVYISILTLKGIDLNPSIYFKFFVFIIQTDNFKDLLGDISKDELFISANKEFKPYLKKDDLSEKLFLELPDAFGILDDYKKSDPEIVERCFKISNILLLLLDFKKRIGNLTVIPDKSDGISSASITTYDSSYSKCLVELYTDGKVSKIDETEYNKYGIGEANDMPFVLIQNSTYSCHVVKKNGIIDSVVLVTTILDKDFILSIYDAVTKGVLQGYDTDKENKVHTAILN